MGKNIERGKPRMGLGRVGEQWRVGRGGGMVVTVIYGVR